jgi:tyrosine-protein phosphatase YwqE
MFSRLFRRGKSGDEKNDAIPADASWSFIGADIHSHFVPGIDDGAKTIEDSIVLLKAMEAMGYKKIVTTPHVMSDFYPNSSLTILTGLKKIQDAARENNINLEISAAAEYYIDEYFTELMAKEPLLPIHKNEVLVEFSMLYEPPMLNSALFSMQTNGYKPIIAHPERYIFFHNKFERYRELRDRGCKLQLNLLSISGYYGRNIMEVAMRLLEKGMYDYCGSDMHHEKHAAALKGMLQTKAYSTLVNYPFLNSQLCF